MSREFLWLICLKNMYVIKNMVPLLWITIQQQVWSLLMLLLPYKLIPMV